MKARRSVAKLRARYEAEHAHADHVARLALGIFDGGRKALGLSGRDRRLLEAACLLHDIVAASGGRDHARRAAGIVLAEGLKGFTDADRATVAAAIVLHAPRAREALRGDPIVRAAGDRAQAVRIAAILRVADGLDHSHVRNASLRSVRPRDGALEVRFRSPGYAGNLRAAEAKADLWQDAMRVPLRLCMVPSPRARTPFRSLIPRAASTLEAASAVLNVQMRIVRDNRKAFLLGDVPESLHDMRVATNRVQAALRFFRPALPEAAAEDFSQRMRALRRMLGPARDTEAYLDFLESGAVAERAARNREWAAYIEARGSALEHQRAGLRRRLRQPGWVRLEERADALLRGEIPSQCDEGSPFRAFAARRLRKRYARLLRCEGGARGHGAEELHAIRKECKRVRYAAEFAAPVLGGAVEQLALRLRAVTGALGTVHDMDVHLAAGGHDGPRRPRALAGLMRARRTKAMESFGKAWSSVTRANAAAKIMRRLKKAEKGER